MAEQSPTKRLPTLTAAERRLLKTYRMVSPEARKALDGLTGLWRELTLRQQRSDRRGGPR